MTAGLNTEANISAFVNTIFENALLVARDQNVMGGLVTVFNDRSGLAVRQNSQYNGASVSTITESDDLTSQVFTPSSIATLTPAEVGAQYFLTDTRVESSPFAVQQDASMDLGQAVGTNIETALVGDFSSFTGGTIGTAGSIISWSYFYNMVSVLRNKKAPMPYSFVCHPYQWNVLGKAASVAGSVMNMAQELGNDINRTFYVGSVSGVNIFVSANISVDTSDDAYAGMFSRAALALDIRRAPRIEAERDASRRGVELNMSAIYAHGVWRPTFGVQGIFDASTPTT
jgi:hypothetical protein